jgi:cell division protein ZapA
MSEMHISIGGRRFTVACQPGEEPFLEAAAQLLDNEAANIVGQLGKLPDAQLLLMAGLMLADRTAGLEDRVRAAEAAGGGPPAPDPLQGVPDDLSETLADLAERAERIAERIEAKAAP